MAIPFVTGIMSDDLPEDPTPEELARHLAPALEARGFPLDGVPNGIWGGDGMYRIVPASTYADRPWHVARHACPFVGALRGYLEWEHWWGPRHIELDYHYSLALAIFEAARGTTVRLDDGRTKEAVRLREIPLGAALSKTGFDDGNALLYRDESDAYRAHVKDAIRPRAREGRPRRRDRLLRRGGQPVRPRGHPVRRRVEGLAASLARRAHARELRRRVDPLALPDASARVDLRLRCPPRRRLLDGRARVVAPCVIRFARARQRAAHGHEAPCAPATKDHEVAQWMSD